MNIYDTETIQAAKRVRQLSRAAFKARRFSPEYADSLNDLFRDTETEFGLDYGVGWREVLEKSAD